MRHGDVATPCMTRGSEKILVVCSGVLLPAAFSRNRYGPWLEGPTLSSRLPLRGLGPTLPFSRPSRVRRERTLTLPTRFASPSIPPPTLRAGSRETSAFLLRR